MGRGQSLAFTITPHSIIANAMLLGYPTETARGMAPQARVAAYKVCWTSGCFTSDILAGMDQAIEDSVDMLSLSLGGSSVTYHRDAIVIGAFAAMQRGIFVACSAGNSGHGVAPWIMTVGDGDRHQAFLGTPIYAY